MDFSLLMIILFSSALVIAVIIFSIIEHKIRKTERKKREARLYIANTKNAILKLINEKEFLKTTDYTIDVNSLRAVDSYDVERFIKENIDVLYDIPDYLISKKSYIEKIKNFLLSNQFQQDEYYDYVESEIIHHLNNIDENFNVKVLYVSPAGRSSKSKILSFSNKQISEIIKSEKEKAMIEQLKYNAKIKKVQEQQLKQELKEKLDIEKNKLTKKINIIMQNVIKNKYKIIFDDDLNKLDDLLYQLKEISLKDVSKLKEFNSDNFNIIESNLLEISKKIIFIVQQNEPLYKYYNSEEFAKLKASCESLLQSKKEFNDYIDQKVESISSYFGTSIERKETNVDDVYDYDRKYKKDLSLFTKEVSLNVFSSAENNPIEYVIKYFFDDKERYPEQIQKLQTLVNELETLKDAKQIVDNYKKEYQEYFANVPSFVFEKDSDGFYEKLGFANINEKTLTFNYKFSYTSNGNKAQKSFLVPMTEENIIKLIEKLQNKLTFSSFTKEQRNLMTSKLRQKIKERDNFTCKCCGNSTYKEPNLLLEIDHIIPVAKGGTTVESNLQTLCWKCNRSKGSKIN